MLERLLSRPPPPCEIRLAGADRVLLRRLRPDDAERLRTGYILLSPQSRRLRFFDQPSEAPLGFLEQLHPRDRVGWGVLDAQAPDGVFLGIARYVRTAPKADAAEVAITVFDPWQGRGVGMLLHAALHRCAARNRLRRFLYEVSEDNPRFIHHLRELGARRGPADHHAVPLEMPVYGRASRVPRSTAAGARFYDVMRGLERAKRVAA
ncbi:MAG TPA: GNAT family N-acetyltransferase [Nevskia sp.]|nr:GNAT family N-acetyltransferase [Nevskia sp.]